VVESIFAQPIFMDYILPFLLVFTLTFAVLDKTKLLGEGKRQINAIISLVIGLILIAFPYAQGIIVKLIPFLAVALVILFIFMLMYGFAMGKKEGDVLDKGVKIALGIIVGLAVIVAVLWATGAWDKVYDTLVGGSSSSQIWMNILLIAIIGGAMAIVLSTGGKKNSG